MTLCPVDEAAQDPAFAAYRTKLLDAVARKDEAAMLPLLADNMRVDFGGGGGIADFQKHWKTSSPDSPLWAELGGILEHGGSFVGEGTNQSFWAPYVYSKWPDDVDAFEHLAVIRAGAPLRDKANAAAVVRTLDWAIVRVLEPASGSQPAWRHVRAPDGTEGWISTKDVRSPIGYRAGFNLVDSQWKMTALVAGD